MILYMVELGRSITRGTWTDIIFPNADLVNGETDVIHDLQNGEKIEYHLM